jgi:hypothetical protein
LGGITEIKVKGIFTFMKAYPNGATEQTRIHGKALLLLNKNLYDM